jgi:NADPH:quinone reductase-like Zn-dependent oxidoreductase
MSTRRAVVVKSAGVAEVKEVPLPKLRDDYIIVKTEAVALNPTDWKGLQRASPGAIVGCDYAGIVEEIGKGVSKYLKVGDKVAGFVRGSKCIHFNSGNSMSDKLGD